MATETPNYTVLKADGDFELRQYEPMIIAKVTVSGSLDQASGRGFRVLADYIFGNNRVNGATISMTAPVTMVAQSERIEMTSPVTLTERNGRWTMQFVMPSDYTMATLPRPNNPAIEIEQRAEQYYAVARFSGFTGEQKVAEQSEALLKWLADLELTPLSAPEIARYDPPWTLPFFRRNEVMVAYQP